MVIRCIAGIAVDTGLFLLLAKVIPFTPDLSDWGGGVFPRTYLFPLFILAVVGYTCAWAGAQICSRYGRLVGLLGSIISAAIVIGWDIGAPVLKPLFHHPLYPLSSDHSLLALAVLLVSGHLGGSRVERRFTLRQSPPAKENSAGFNESKGED